MQAALFLSHEEGERLAVPAGRRQDAKIFSGLRQRDFLSCGFQYVLLATSQPVADAVGTNRFRKKLRRQGAVGVGQLLAAPGEAFFIDGQGNFHVAGAAAGLLFHLQREGRHGIGVKIEAEAAFVAAEFLADALVAFARADLLEPVQRQRDAQALLRSPFSLLDAQNEPIALFFLLAGAELRAASVQRKEGDLLV